MRPERKRVIKFVRNTSPKDMTTVAGDEAAYYPALTLGVGAFIMGGSGKHYAQMVFLYLGGL